MDETNGATPTLNVDSLGAKAIQGVSGTVAAESCSPAVSTNSPIRPRPSPAGSSAGCFRRQSKSLAGTVMLFMQTAAPTGGRNRRRTTTRRSASSLGHGKLWRFDGVYQRIHVAHAIPNGRQHDARDRRHSLPRSPDHIWWRRCDERFDERQPSSHRLNDREAPTTGGGTGHTHSFSGTSMILPSNMST